MKIVTRSGVSAPTPLFAVGVSCAIMALALPMRLRGASSALSRCCLEVRSLSEVKTTLKSSSVGKALAEALSSTFGEAPKA